MFPYANSRRWMLASPPSHLLEALERRPDMANHPLVRARSAQIRRYLAVRLAVMVLLYAGALATLIGWLSRYMPGVTRDAADALATIAGTLGALTGLFTLAYILLSRLVQQCLMDIVGHFMLGMPYQQ